MDAALLAPSVYCHQYIALHNEVSLCHWETRVEEHLQLHELIPYQSKIILVFGCGGDRDTSKRSLMGRIAGKLADHSIVTSDNPRSEDPQLIIDQIVEGFSEDNYKVVVNRKEAIEQALRLTTTL